MSPATKTRTGSVSPKRRHQVMAATKDPAKVKGRNFTKREATILGPLQKTMGKHITIEMHSYKIQVRYHGRVLSGLRIDDFTSEHEMSQRLRQQASILLQAAGEFEDDGSNELYTASPIGTHVRCDQWPEDINVVAFNCGDEDEAIEKVRQWLAMVDFEAVPATTRAAL